jgi:hypothetical protein
MANNVISIVSGGRPTTHSASTPEELLQLMEVEGTFTVTVQGKPASMDADLSDYDQVKFTESVKGGL